MLMFKRLIIYYGLIAFMFCSPAFAAGEEHPIDRFERECIKKDWTTTGMANCTYEALDKWDQEMNRYYSLLMELLDEEQQAVLKRSQEAWIKYRDAEFDNASSVYVNEKGSMFINIIAADQKAVVKRRALDLRRYYNILEERHVK